MSPALLCFLAVRLFSNHGQHGESLPFLRAPSAAASLTRGSLSAAFSARSSAIPPKRLSPEWARLSDDLTALVLREGPVQLGKVSGAYHAMHGKPLKLYGSTLTQIIKSGNLQGIRYDTSKLVIRLDETTTAGKTSARKPGLPELSKRLRSLVAVKGSLPLSSIAAKYKSVYGRELKSHLPTRGLKKNLVKGNLKGIRYNAKRDKVEVNDTQVMPAKGSRSPTTPQLAKKRKLISAAAVNQSGDEKLVGTDSLDQGEGERRRSTPKNGNTSIRQPDNDDKVLPLSSTRDPPLPHLLIDSPDSCTKSLVALSCGGALRSTLQQICVRGMVVMQLNGHQLGSEAGKISFVKLKIVRPSISSVVILDVEALSETNAGQKVLQEQLCPLLADQRTTKVVYDFSNSAIALRRHFDHKSFVIRQVLDLQLAFEALNDRVGADIILVVNGFAHTPASSRNAAWRASRYFAYGATVSARRPLAKSTLESAAQTITSLAEVAETAVTRLSEKRQKGVVLEASQLVTEFAMSCMLQDTRRVTFRNHGSCWGGGVGRVVISLELKQAREKMARVADKASARAKQPRCSTGARASVDGRNLNEVLDGGLQQDPNSPHELFKLIPEAFLEEHLTQRHAQNLRNLHELVLDEGRRPYAIFQGHGKLFLCGDKTVVVTKDDIDRVVGDFSAQGKFAGDNRAGVSGQLHRISVMRSREEGRIFGVTLRVGRYFPGSAGLIDDLLFHVKDSPNKPERAASVLVLGKPGSGKTTVLRDICRKISQEQTVIVVDTSNEIAGDGDIPHLEAIGQSRRMVVPDKTQQHRVMKEALQNHTPQTIVVDEISDKDEARACLDIKARGVRVVASAHGDLQSLLKNPELNTLLGGTTSVTIGDEAAKATNSGKKVKSQRAGTPIFDTVIELERGKVSTWSIVRNVDVAVDAILSGRPYNVEQRTSIPHDDPALSQEGSSPEDAAFLLKHVKGIEKTRQYY